MAADPKAKVALVDRSAPLAGDVVVVGILSSTSGPKLAPGASPVDEALGGTLLAGLRAAGAAGKADEVTKVPTLGLADFPLVVACGLGTELTAESVRRGVGAALRGLASKKSITVAIDGPVDALAEGAALGAYSYTAYKSGSTARAARKISIAATADAANKAALKRAKVLTDAMALVRDLVNMPPNDLYPATFAERAAAEATAAGLEVEVLDERALKRGKFGGILAVGSGSSRPPRLVRVTYRPAKPVARVALVGKGITFDSGGLNIKTANMTWMKSDMGGAAAVIASTIAIAALKLPIEVIATAPMAENMPSGTSYRPSDILTLRNGRTVEVSDTDAEGRLILADGIIRALEDDPDYLIETSTLTGGQLVALGPRVIGAMGQPDWRNAVTAAGNAAGENVWAMPIPEELRPALDSPVADMQSLPGDRWASMLVGAAFLSDFVPADFPWVHLDIAGPAFNFGGPYGYTPKGGTGAAVRTITASVASLAR